MSIYLKSLGCYVYLAATKYKMANAQALRAIRNSLSKEYLSMISHCDSAFAVWNIDLFRASNTNQYGGKI